MKLITLGSERYKQGSENIIGSVINLYLSKLGEAKFFILHDVIISGETGNVGKFGTSRNLITGLELRMWLFDALSKLMVPKRKFSSTVSGKHGQGDKTLTNVRKSRQMR